MIFLGLDLNCASSICDPARNSLVGGIDELARTPVCPSSSMPPTSEFLAGSQIDEAQFKSRPRKIMNYLFRINELPLSDCSTSGRQWDFVLYFDNSVNGL